MSDALRLPCGRRFAVTRHALDRYLERVLAHNGSVGRARELLMRLAGEHGEFSPEPPEWVVPGEESEKASGYVLLGPDVCLPVVGPLIVTTLARGSVSDGEREARTRKRRGKQAHKWRKRYGTPAAERGPMRRARRDALAPEATREEH